MKAPSETTGIGTRLVHAGASIEIEGGKPVNPPVVRASTVLFDTVGEQQALRGRREQEQVFTYGSYGTPTAFALERSVAELEGGFRTRLFPTGLSAAAMTMLAFLKPGDHVLIVDSVYEPVRHLAASFLVPYNIEHSFFSPDGTDVEAAIRPSTRLIYTECPGSLVFEMCDLPRLAEIAHARGILVAVDNTWGSGILYRPLELGADISIIAATKYLGGHSDVMMGTATTTEAAWSRLQERCNAFGIAVSPDDAWLVLRGMRTLSARLAIHQKSAFMVAEWLGSRAEVAQVFFPALKSHDGYAVWRRDCRGVNGLLSFELNPNFDRLDAERLVNAFQVFGIGSSWGGYESLASLPTMSKARTLKPWAGRGPVIRLHVGLEDTGDLLGDLERAFASLQNE